MERTWKVLSVWLGLCCVELCNGFPINLENTAADSHTQLLTGLVAVLLTVCSVVLLAGCLCCQRGNGFKEFRDSPVVASTASNLDHGHVNPVANGEFTIFTPLSPPHQNNNVFLANQQIITRTVEDYGYGDVDVSSWFNGSEKDFPRIKLKYIRELGRGWFGKVVEGAANDVTDAQTWTPVVVRILEASATSRERVVFLHDAAIYRCGDHPNILKIIGRCLDTIPLLLLQEYCPQGDLKKYLRDNKATADKLLSTEYPLMWCCQLSAALKHLHEHKITHPDLATRNCQLSSNLTLKLGDYGLSVFQYPNDYYQGAPGVPVRWCAPESLTCTSTTIQPKKTTLEANVWSLGVTMWEITECGAQPYESLTDDEVVSQVVSAGSVRLERPSYPVLYTDYIYRLMQLCWTPSAESRPAVAQIDLMLRDLLQVHHNTKTPPQISADDFDKRWASLKPNFLVKTDHLPECDDPTITIETSKPLSPSLNNLHGSLDNLLSNPKIEFKLGPTQTDSLSDSTHRTSSESETEDENWKKKVERGAYTEKVRLKSRSVADLMVLTHVDYSESESETPLPSLDYRVNYRNVRYAPKSNLEGVSLTFGSEGNLLSVQDTFGEELRKLQEERRDSLLFVPDSHSRNLSASCSNSNKDSEVQVKNVSNLEEDSPTKRLMQELNSPSEIQPANQVYNVFNVTIDKFSPVHVDKAKLDEIIHYKTELEDCGKLENSLEKPEDITQDLNETNVYGGQTEAVPNSSDPPKQVPKLADLILNNDGLMDFILEHYDEDSADVPNTKPEDLPKVAFDLSQEQDETTPNSLTHSSVFNSTPAKEDAYSSLNLFSVDSNAESKDLNYSLETWGNYLEKTLDDEKQQPSDLFDSFTSEEKPSENELNTTYTLEDGPDKLNETFTLEKDVDDGSSSEGTWETGGGWFLHPQSTCEDMTGDMVPPPPGSDSYVGFSMDDEVMAQIRNELLKKLPHAQGTSSDKVEEEEEEEEWKQCERNEVFLHYNVYNAPLSPIPEESYIESGENTPKVLSDEDDSDWEQGEPEIPPVDTESISVHTFDSPIRGPLHRHTPSQDSCCSNDTLFNLEELTCIAPEPDKDNYPTIVECAKDESLSNEETVITVENDSSQMKQSEHNNNDSECDKNFVVEDENVDESSTLCAQTVDSVEASLPVESAGTTHKYIESFLVNERQHGAMAVVTVTEPVEEPPSRFVNKQVAPLPSPEDNPWKQLPASQLTFDKVLSQNNTMLLPVMEIHNTVPEKVEGVYENIENASDIYNEADYVNLENSKNIERKNESDDEHEKLIISNDGLDEVEDEEVEEDDEDLFGGVLTDIRFHGPNDLNLMSTSFSESNDLNDEQDWDSGSDTRSSSSGEFIWKLDDVKPMEGILEETSSESSASSSDDECETPEFVPSAWDKFAIPVKSALRSPEKTLEKDEKKSKGVWFKKQKYHCVYEYPREPESPILHSHDLWKPQSDFAAFTAGNSNVDDEFFISSSAAPFDMIGNLSSQFFPGGSAANHWSPENVTPDSGTEDITPASLIDDYPVVKTIQPLKILASAAVNKTKTTEVKPSDVLGGLRHTRNKLKLDLPPSPSAFTSGKIFNVEPVEIRDKPTFSTFGKSRFLVQHVDSPPDDSSTHKNVSFEALPYKPLDKEKNEMNDISACNDYGYQPLQKHILKDDFEDECKAKVEMVRGEASLLDSADEDSGIESSTLERKLGNVAVD